MADDGGRDVKDDVGRLVSWAPTLAGAGLCAGRSVPGANTTSRDWIKSFERLP